MITLESKNRQASGATCAFWPCKLQIRGLQERGELEETGGKNKRGPYCETEQQASAEASGPSTLIETSCRRWNLYSVGPWAQPG